ncbi:glycoside hydrolase family 36 protein [Paenibacillaceae bacterium WGS1546]|uniref:glycoside hydrolase family 36 protein n=1 Tax=Cohnella sp. WGS1546 TaxID=3366810 RepID=UPI00372D5705
MKASTDRHVFRLDGAANRYQASLSCAELNEGVYAVKLVLQADERQAPDPMKLSWEHPISDIHGYWNPKTDRNDGLIPDWREEGYAKSSVAYSAPVGCLYNVQGLNRLTFAYSDALNPLRIRVGVNEESASFHCSLSLFEERTAPFDNYEAELLVDVRPIPYFESLQDIQIWWSKLPGYEPMTVPPAARQPMYSTWYSFHQSFTSEQLEEQCAIAKELGCDSIIVDDGWQTSDARRGYAYCGDWEPFAGKIPEMRAHVDRVHRLGMNYILWYSVPFIGRHSNAWRRFEDKLLYFIDRLGAGVVDPRFPEVREYLIQTYEKAVSAWNLDGLKLDFIDRFRHPGDQEQSLGGGRDIASVPEAVDRLMSDIAARLKAIKPDMLIEFRQNYVGPLMRKYGNMFRAADCPNDAIENRVRTLDIRLLSGDTSVHSDMLMWSVEEPVESAALQLLNVLFSVPQISMKLDRLPADHMAMLKFWLGFWRENRDALLDGRLEPRHPELLYPLVLSSASDRRIAAVYHDTIVNPGAAIPARLTIVNGTLNDRVILELNEEMGETILHAMDCQGATVMKEKRLLLPGVHRLDVPPAGLLTIEKREKGLPFVAKE